MLFGLFHSNLEQFLYTIFMGIVCANIVLITGKVRYAIYLHMAFNLFGAIISDYIPSGRYTILTEIIFVISAAIIVILKAKTVFIIKDEANVNKFNFKKEFCGIGFIMFMGIAKPMPSASSIFRVVIPMISPFLFIRGPPLFPWFIVASVWISPSR